MEKTKAKHRPLRIIKNTIFAVVFILLAVIIATTLITRIYGGTPSAFGYSIFRVSSASMEPVLEVGDVIIVKECDPSEIEVGDIVTFEGESGSLEGKLVTHRVIEAPFEQDGEYYIRTQGDANDEPDPDVRVECVTGKMLSTVPVLDYIYSFFVTPWGLLAVIFLIILAFFNEFVNFFKALTGVGYEKEKPDIESIIERVKAQEGEQQPAKLPESDPEQNSEEITPDTAPDENTEDTEDTENTDDTDDFPYII